MVGTPETKSTFRFRKRNALFLCTSSVCLGALLNYYLQNPNKYKSLRSGSEASLGSSQFASNASSSHELQNNTGVRGGVAPVASGENVHNSPLLDNNGSITAESNVAIITTEPKVEMAPAGVVTNTHNESQSDKFLNTSDHITTTNDSGPVAVESSSTEQNKTSSFITKNGINCDDIGDDCRGFFAYSGPNNHALNATAITQEVASTYNYGPEKNTDGHLIFFPNTTNSQACIEEWKSAKFGGRGMSAWREDITIYEAFFKSQGMSSNSSSPGFYMEIGAHDGVRESNSRFFDLCLGWKGLLVEPHPMNYGKMEKLRPNAFHLGLAPSCNTSDVVKFANHEYTNANAFDPKGEIEIHCGPLSYYLKQLHISHIDFWSLDVEGSEINILRTVDFDQVQIDVIMAESMNSQKGKGELAQEVRSYLVQQKDYLHLNSVSVTKSDVFLHKRACHRYNHIPECRTLQMKIGNATE